MPQAPTLYPRATVKKIVKAHANKPLSRNVDILVFLDYVAFLEECVYSLFCLGGDKGRSGTQKANSIYRLLNEANIASKRAGERGISAKRVRAVREGVLRRYEG
jgi:hypothetical protein